MMKKIKDAITWGTLFTMSSTGKGGVNVRGIADILDRILENVENYGRRNTSDTSDDSAVEERIAKKLGNVNFTRIPKRCHFFPYTVSTLPLLSGSDP